MTHRMNECPGRTAPRRVLYGDRWKCAACGYQGEVWRDAAGIGWTCPPPPLPTTAHYMEHVERAHDVARHVQAELPLERVLAELLDRAPEVRIDLMRGEGHQSVHVRTYGSCTLTGRTHCAEEVATADLPATIAKLLRVTHAQVVQ